MLEKVKHNPSLPTDLRKLIKDKEGRELRMQVLKFSKTAGKTLLQQLVALMVSGMFGV